MRYPNEVFSVDALIDRIWPSETDTAPDSVRIHVMRLRKKIPEQGQPFKLKTVHGMGYKFEVTD
jgi:DNA-binding response OmpR family regulator